LRKFFCGKSVLYGVFGLLTLLLAVVGVLEGVFDAFVLPIILVLNH
jgi:hypothetical protein